MFENWTRGAKITSKLVCLGQTIHWKFQASPKAGGVVGPPATKGRLVFLGVFWHFDVRMPGEVGWGMGQGGVGWGVPCYWIFSCTRRFPCICMLCYWRFSCTCTQTSCFATEGSLAFAHRLCYATEKSLALAHGRHATLWIFSCTCGARTSCHATEGSLALAHRPHALLPKFLLHLDTDFMRR